MKRNSCKTCALKVSLPQSDTEGAKRVDEIYKEFKIRHPKSSRIIDASIGGDGSGDKTEFCAIGSRHFKKQGQCCFQWVPTEIGLTISDALAINLNRKLLWLTVIIVFLTISSIVISLFMLSKDSQPIQRPIKITTQNLPAQKNNSGQRQTEKKIKEDEAKKDAKPQKPIQNNIGVELPRQTKQPVPRK